ncbi:uncharacterized protein LOC126990313, partial [Eriocheir sinensis]|uniref:uncharacterized protein LOC126990313 n=1 Tax=Eriocheir sinensis TaxID=95602 RepID=UPI0021C85BB6
MVAAGVHPSVSSLQDTGILGHLLKMNVQEAKACARPETSVVPTTTLRPLTLEDFGGVFFLFGIDTTLSPPHPINHLILHRYLDKIHLVYQWIPPRQPQPLGVLAGRVDTAYRASSDPWAAHRALYIPRPHPALTGQYCCTVSTFEDEDWRTAPMLVWAPPHHVEVRLWRPSEHLVNVTCTAAGASPRPEFYLYTRDANGTRQEVGVRGLEGRRDGGVWGAGAWGLLLWEETEGGTLVGCTVTLPGAPHTETRTTIYRA